MYYCISSEILACSYAKIEGKIGYVCMYVRTVLFEPSSVVNLKYGELASLPLDRQGVIQERVPERLRDKRCGQT